MRGRILRQHYTLHEHAQHLKLTHSELDGGPAHVHEPARGVERYLTGAQNALVGSRGGR